MKSSGNLTPIHLAGLNPVQRQFLIFRINQQEYGVDVRFVQTLRLYCSLTQVSNGTELVDGVVMVDQAVMPIVDLRQPFHLVAPSYERQTVVMILNLRGRLIAAAVDSVSELLALSEEQIESLPERDGMLGGDFLIGSAAFEQRRVLLLDPELLFPVWIESIEKRAA